MFIKKMLQISQQILLEVIMSDPLGYRTKG